MTIQSAKTVVVGDIHGCYDELMDLLDQIGIGPRDRVIAVGDLITKGPKNREVLDLFINDVRFSSVIGNQDLAVLRCWRGEPNKLTAAQAEASKQLAGDRGKYYSYLGSLPPRIDLGTHLIVHAGVRPGVSLRDQSLDDLTDLRTLGADRSNREGTPWYEVYDVDHIVLFGHWPAPEPRIGPHAIGLDTGCVYGNRLTAYIIETKEFVSVTARRAYAEYKGLSI